MRRSSFRRRRRVGVLVLLLLFTTLLLVSCVAGSNVLWVRGILGLDIGDYAAERVERTHTTDGTVAQMLTETVEILLDHRTHLTPFAGTDEAVSIYRDRILNAMLRSGYSLYVGNRAYISAAEAAYPHAVYSTLIPKKDFENTVYRYFGGTSVDHGDGDVFAYLKNAAFYTSPVSARDCTVSVNVRSIEETANTYRMSFTLSDGEETSSLYQALFVKRDDGTVYWKALEIKK